MTIQNFINKKIQSHRSEISFKERIKMKNIRLFISLCIGTFLIFISYSCEYDVAEPLWEQEFAQPSVPEISQIEPASGAAPGVNTIKINGTNFIQSDGTVAVYFDNLQAEVVSSNQSSIVVRRPNMVTSTSEIKVVPSKALIVAKYKPYRIDAVSEKYGSFLDNVQLAAVAVDKSENLFVVDAISRAITKVTPAGAKSVFATASRTVSDAVFGPDGNLYYMGLNRAIDVINMNTGTNSRWIQLPAGKIVKYGDFDSNGYFYTGGIRTDLIIVAPNLTVNTGSGTYLTEEILAVRIGKGYVYVASKNAQGVVSIFKHKITNGTLGTQELVLDLSKHAAYSSRTIKAMSISQDDRLFVATDSQDPFIVVDLSSNAPDLFYKTILPPYCKHFAWGADNYIYMITGDTPLAQDWTVFRVNFGSKQALK